MTELLIKVVDSEHSKKNPEMPKAEKKSAEPENPEIDDGVERILGLFGNINGHAKTPVESKHIARDEDETSAGTAKVRI